jgi:hypothetical protein
MSDALAYSQVLMQQEATVIVLGLVFVLAFQLVVFGWAERSYLVTATYLVATIAFVGGPFVAAVVETPNRVFNIYDREVLWTLLSFLMTIVLPPSQGTRWSAANRINPPRRKGLTKIKGVGLSPGRAVSSTMDCLLARVVKRPCGSRYC